jgi:PAS domain-containing protein
MDTPKTHIEVTEEAWRELRSSERRFRAVFNQMFQFASILHLDGTILEDNQSVCKLI